METIAAHEVLAKLPQREVEQTITSFVRPVVQLLPDQRLREVVPVALRGIVAGETPIITAMARSISRQDASTWAVAKRIYRFVDNPRFSHHHLYKGLYRLAQQSVEQEQPPYVVVAIDPVNFEKPYTQTLPGVSTVHKSTPPDLQGKARLTHGYPAITATVVNTQVPTISYANWFSYTLDFLSQNWEIYRAIRTTHAVFPKRRVRFVGDCGLDDQKIFAWMQFVQAEFVIRVQHLNRIVEVYNTRLDRWEREVLEDLVDTVPFSCTWQVLFTHARKTRLVTMQVGWLRIRLPGQEHSLWVLVAQDSQEQWPPLVLLTNVAIESEHEASALYTDWRLRGRIEQGYRFDQEQGLDVEDIQVRTLERMRRLFALVLLAAQLIFHLMHTWPPLALRWLRLLGGKLDRSSDLDGPYILLRGLQALFQTFTTLSLLSVLPFPHDAFT